MPTIKCYDPKQTWAAEDELPKDAEALASSGKTVYVKEVDSRLTILTLITRLVFQRRQR